MEITFEYWNKLADQIVTISSLLAGFSIAVIANILVSDIGTKLMKRIMVAASLAASCFLVTVFAMTKLLLMSTGWISIGSGRSSAVISENTGDDCLFLWHHGADYYDFIGRMD